MLTQCSYWLYFIYDPCPSIKFEFFRVVFDQEREALASIEAWEVWTVDAVIEEGKAS
jgi:hypothetical protein